MAKTCVECEVVIKTWTDPMHFPEEKIKPLFQALGISDSVVEKMQEKDLLCKKCGNKAFCRHAVVIYNHNKTQLLPEEFENLLKSGEDWIPIAQAELASSPQTQISETTPVTTGMTAPSIPTTNKAGKITTAAELTRLTDSRHDQTKAQWNKSGIVQYKDEGIAILQRKWGSQVQFIVACSQVTTEGYRLMAIDEGKEGSSGGFSGGVNAYFYFQRMDYVR
jgi:hypothetical protein